MGFSKAKLDRAEAWFEGQEYSEEDWQMALLCIDEKGFMDTEMYQDMENDFTDLLERESLY